MLSTLNFMSDSSNVYFSHEVRSTFYTFAKHVKLFGVLWYSLSRKVEGMTTVLEL
jgi:hypothetical protein